MQLHRLSELGGVSVEGVDLSAPRSPAEDRALKDLYDQHGLAVFRDQHLDKRQLVEAGAPFGGTMMKKETVAYAPGAPGIVVVSTRGPDGTVVPEDPNALVGDLEWHSDQGYLTTPNRGKILYAVEVPPEGGKTGFIDGALTYAALSDELKARLDGLHVIQSWRRAESYLLRNQDYRVKGRDEMRPDRYPDVAYPMVSEHPVTGVKVLNVPPLWSAGIVELPGAKGLALIEQLVAHIRQPRFQYWHQYRVGDAVLWDNWRFIHAASGTPGRHVRTLWAVTINSGPKIGMALETAVG
jgi:taurine dioxygenase